MLYSGIDLHKRSVVIHTLDAHGATIAEASLPTQRTAITSYFTNLEGPHQAVVECTGTWYWLRDLLVPQGVDLRLGHAKYLKAISYAKVKTDKVDARMLADLLRVDLIPEAHMISAAQRETRDLLRARLQLVTRAMRCQLTLGGLLAKYNVASPAELPEYPQLQAAFQVDQRALLVQQRKQLDQRHPPTADSDDARAAPRVGAGHRGGRRRHARL